MQAERGAFHLKAFSMYYTTGILIIFVLRNKSVAKVDKLTKIEPPIHAKYFLSGDAITRALIFAGANLVNSFVNRLSIPGINVLPPQSTIFRYNSRA